DRIDHRATRQRQHLGITTINGNRRTNRRIRTRRTGLLFDREGLLAIVGISMLSNRIPTQRQILKHHKIPARILSHLLTSNLKRHRRRTRSSLRRELRRRRNTSLITSRRRTNFARQIIGLTSSQTLKRDRIDHRATRQRQHLGITTINGNRRTNRRIRTRLVTARQLAKESVVVNLAAARGCDVTAGEPLTVRADPGVEIQISMRRPDRSKLESVNVDGTGDIRQVEQNVARQRLILSSLR